MFPVCHDFDGRENDCTIDDRGLFCEWQSEYNHCSVKSESFCYFDCLKCCVHYHKKHPYRAQLRQHRTSTKHFGHYTLCIFVDKYNFDNTGILSGY